MTEMPTCAKNLTACGLNQKSTASRYSFFLKEINSWRVHLNNHRQEVMERMQFVCECSPHENGGEQLQDHPFTWFHSLTKPFWQLQTKIINIVFTMTTFVQYVSKSIAYGRVLLRKKFQKNLVPTDVPSKCVWMNHNCNNQCIKFL